MAATATQATGRITEVEVLRRWRGSPVNAMERCGIPEALATELAALDPPAVRIIRTNVPQTAGIGANGVIGGDTPVDHGAALHSLIAELIGELRANRSRK